MPFHFNSVEANHVLEVQQYSGQAVQLISQPEISKPHVMERRRHNTKLEATMFIHYDKTTVSKPREAAEKKSVSGLLHSLQVAQNNARFATSSETTDSQR